MSSTKCVPALFVTQWIEKKAQTFSTSMADLAEKKNCTRENMQMKAKNENRTGFGCQFL